MEKTRKRVLVTSGPTRAYFDRIRYIANTSTGVLGARIVETILAQDIRVTHIYGKGSEQLRGDTWGLLEAVRVVTVDDVISSVKAAAARGDIGAVVHAMAVLDYVPEVTVPAKKSSGDDHWDIRLVRTPKVWSLIRELIPQAFTVGFKLEVKVSETELIRRAGLSLEKYGLDMVVANDLDRVNAQCHEALFIGPGNTLLYRAETKEDIARYITECIIGRLNVDV